MKIAFFDLEGWEQDVVRGRFPSHELYLTGKRLDTRELGEAAGAEAVSVFINSPMDRAAIEAFPDLKLIATRSTGFDHIDRAACKERNIVVSYVPGYGDNTVAEFAFGLILNLTRKIYESIDQIKEKESFSLKGLRGMDIKGKTLGILGTGRIGRETARIAKGFGMEVIAYDPYPNKEFATGLGVTYVPFEEALRRSDVISINCPYMPETHHLINAETVKHIKKGAYLVNVSRGGIVETAAIIDALNDGTLAGFATDVLEEEGETKDEMHYLLEGRADVEAMKTMLRNHVLMHMPNVLVTPHNAFNSKEAFSRILETTLENIEGFSLGAPKNLVPEQK